jgi:WD40 repeat protein/tRNA A-37 threonylcarbamoyl transferase component Bud32
MPIDSVPGLLDALRQARLLPPAQLGEAQRLQAHFPDPRSLAGELVRRGWLTPYQINQLFRGRGSSLLLGQYVLLERLGEGGMGQVLKARHQKLDRMAAVKVIRSERLSNPTIVERFQREARAAARLSHPNIVTVYDADEVGGTHFFAMEYVEGTDLAKLVKEKGPLPVAVACDYVRQAALGLQHAHEQGLVHRDIKPANLFLAARAGGPPPADGVIKILDMGLARLQGRLEESGDATDPLTQEGAVMGTPDYMAPEQATDSHRADIRADLYSLGATLYYLLTGRAPFADGTLANKLLRLQMEEAPPVERLRPDVPPGVAAVVRKLLAKRPEQRCQTPAELARNLEPFCRAAVAVAVLAPAGAGGPAIPAIPLGPHDPTAAWSGHPVAIPVGKGVEDTIPPAEAESAASLPQTTAPLPRAWAGKHRLRLVAGAAALAALVLLVVLVVRRTNDRITGSGDKGTGPDQSGQPSAFDARILTGMKRAPNPFPEYTERLPEEMVGSLGDLWGRHWGAVRSVAFRPDGKLAASGGEDNLIRLWDAQTLEPRGILPGLTFPVHALAFSPNGKTLASCCDRSDFRVWLWDLETKKIAYLEGHGNIVTQLAFSTDGKWLLSAGQDQVVYRWDVATRQHNPPLTLPPGVLCVALSPDGRHVLSGHADKTLRLWDLDTRQERALPGHTEVIDAVTFSPDGSRAVSISRNDGSVRLWDVEQGKQLQQWVGNLGSPDGLAFTPNGERIAWISANNAIIVIDAKTLAVVGQLSPGNLAGLALSPDNHRALVFGPGQTILRLWDLGTGVQVRAPSGHVRAVASVAFAPDGHYLLSGSHDSTVTLWDLESQRSVGGFAHGTPVYSVAISPDGKYALAGGTEAGNDHKTLRFWEIDRRQLAVSLDANPNATTMSVAFSSDGRLALSGGGGDAPQLRLWDVEKRVEARPFAKLDESITGVAFLPGTRQAVSGGAQKVVRLWDVDTGKEVRSLVGHTDAVTSVAGSPAGRHVLSGSLDTTVRLWDLQETEPKGRLLEDGPKAGITCVTFAPNGERLAASGSDGRVAVWERASGKRLYHVQLPGGVQGLAFARDSRHLATANANGTAYILRLPETSPGGR